MLGSTRAPYGPVGRKTDLARGRVVPGDMASCPLPGPDVVGVGCHGARTLTHAHTSPRRRRVAACDHDGRRVSVMRPVTGDGDGIIVMGAHRDWTGLD